jgi:uncharacterized membrane protein YfcA
VELFAASLFAVATIAGGVAAVAGFGIGSLLTPLVALVAGTKLAVAFVSIPHAAGTVLRFLRLRSFVDWRTFRGFGLASAAGGLAGAALHGRASSPALGAVLGGLLVFAGVSTLSGLADRIRFRGRAALAAGVTSGFFGGLVGNQGGIRSAALLGLDLDRDAFVATATAAALVVDAARVGFYLAFEGQRLLRLWPLIATATAGVLIGTIGGERVLRRIPEAVFRKVVAATLVALGLAMLAASLS